MIKIKLLSDSEVKYKQANENWFKNLMVEFCLQVLSEALETLSEWYKCGCPQKCLYGVFCACFVSICPTSQASQCSTEQHLVQGLLSITRSIWELIPEFIVLHKVLISFLLGINFLLSSWYSCTSKWHPLENNLLFPAVIICYNVGGCQTHMPPLAPIQILYNSST